MSGGIEFYGKALERNALLRDLLGPDEGPKMFTPTGNVNSVFRQRDVPLTARKEALEKRLTERGVADGEQQQRVPPSLENRGSGGRNLQEDVVA